MPIVMNIDNGSALAVAASYPASGSPVRTPFSLQGFASQQDVAPVVAGSVANFGAQLLPTAQPTPAGIANYGFSSMVGNAAPGPRVDLSLIQGTIFNTFSKLKGRVHFRRSA